MISAEKLEQAVRRGIISVDQRDELLALDDDPDTGVIEAARPATDEPLRLVGGGNDLFVTVGVVLLFAGLLFVLRSTIGTSTPVIAGMLGILVWLVAEFVTRQRRMRLSSTLLGLGFLGAAAKLVSVYLEGRIDPDSLRNPLQYAALRPQAGIWSAIFFGVIAAAAVIYFLRFRVPIMAAILALCLTGFAFVSTTLFFYDSVTSGTVLLPTPDQIPDVIARALYVPLACGVIIFVTGVAFDLHDRERHTVWSDCAFWLHVISAPLLVHPLFILATGQEVVFGEIEPGMIASIMLGMLFGGFVYVALAIDRRSLLVPTFAYFGSLGIYYLIDGAANTTDIPPFALILLVIGGLIILFGAGWQNMRRLIVGSTLPTSVLSKLPPIKV
ncbi:hypothetical protein [Oricola cellulosilytica]|uniref:DUF2157 domain-containing protein n=1 Tax=Oricola cellulosilytica TaxID=1429082 RepID=A0A4R0PK35_9HYPH|nr:hypothetical protein [Oricola cellulosilytica]TCD15999.1 hypothetical protein E0D97_00720 [Oricola cellulosilytica]